MFLLINVLLLSGISVRTIYADSGGTNYEQRVVVKGVSHQSASLPCYIDEENCGAIYFLTWSRLEKDDRWSRIWVYSDDNVNKALNTLTGRAIFTKQKSEARLVINSLKPSDEAFYKCDVTYVAGKCPSLTYVQLNVIAKPTRSWIEHEGDILSNGHHLSLTEGDYLKLACTVINGRPRPVISWRSIDSRGQRHELKHSPPATSIAIIDDNNNNNNGLVNTNDDDIATLVLTKKLTRDDLGTQIECHIEHEAINNGTLDQHVVLDVSVGIKTTEIIGPSTSVREGDIAVIECVAYGSKPAADIIWRNGSRIIDAHSVQNTIETNADRITVNSRSKLEIIVGHQDHLNPITCEAANVAMRTPINKSTEISVLFAPIVVMEPQNGLTVNESTPMVSIYCTYYANPINLLDNETIWFKNGRPLDTTDRTRYALSSTNHPTLTILKVSRNDTGLYHCSLANSLGSGVPNTSVTLNVLYPPIVSLLVYPDPSSDYLLKEGDKLSMICDILDGNPRSASKMRWLKNNGETFSELDSDTSSQKELSWLSIPRSLTGNYTCQAISEAGPSELSNEVEINVHYPPGKSIIRLLDEPYPIKGRNLTLECIVNDRGRPSEHTEYHWENSDGMIFDSRQSILTIQNVRLVNRGNITCSGINEVGSGARGMFELLPYAPPRFINLLPATVGVNENLRSTTSLNDKSDANGYISAYSHQANHNRFNNGNDETYGYVTNDLKDPNINVLGPSDTINLYCRVECFPLCSITWYRNDQPIDNGTSNGEFRIIEEQLPEEFLLNRFAGVESTLIWNISRSGRTFLDRIRDSGTIFSCVSSGNLVGSSVRSDSKFQVEYAPENLRLSSTRVDVIENEQLPEISCDSDALPPANYRWISSSFFDKFTGVIADTPNLALNRSLQRDSAGTYTCIASNRHGERRIDLQINVLYRPSCSIYESRTGKDNQDVVLICEVTFANPNTGLEFNWSLNGTQLNASYVEQISQQDGLKSKIIIASTQDLFGTWTCSVRNTVGQTDPNCTLFVDVPMAAEWSALGDESILIISGIIVAIIFAFLFVLLCLIFLMKRRRHKNEKVKRENPDGDRSPTPSSSTSRVSSNQNDLISQKSQASSKKATETERLSSSNSSALAMPTSADLYDNMSYRKPNCMAHLNGTASFFHHSGNNLSTLQRQQQQVPLSPVPPTYDNATKTLSHNDAFRRTQSARFNQNHNRPIYSIYNDPSQTMLYGDLKLSTINNNSSNNNNNNKNNCPMTNIVSTGANVGINRHLPIKNYSYHALHSHTHHHPFQSSLANHPSNIYQQLGPAVSAARNLQSTYNNNNSHSLLGHNSNNNNNNNNNINNNNNNGSSSNSSTPPSLSTSSTNSNNINYNGNSSTINSLSKNNGSSTLNHHHNQMHLHHTYDKLDSIKHHQQSFLTANNNNNNKRLISHSPFNDTNIVDRPRRSANTLSSSSSSSTSNNNNNNNHHLQTRQSTVGSAGTNHHRAILYHTNSASSDTGSVDLHGAGSLLQHQPHCEYAILQFDHPSSPQSSQC